MKSNLFCWNENSEGAKQLAAALGIKRIKHQNSKYKGSDRKVVVNWGSTNLPDEVRKSRIINKPDAIERCSNKLTFFEYIAKNNNGVMIPDWTNDFDVAVKWVAAGFMVCARTILNGHSAAGLVLMHKDDPKSLVKAQLYTKYVPKKDEYRVHVVGGEVIDIQRKAIRNGWIEEHGADNINFKIRNLANGFVYVRQDVKPPAKVGAQALAAMKF